MITPSSENATKYTIMKQFDISEILPKLKTLYRIFGTVTGLNCAVFWGTGEACCLLE